MDKQLATYIAETYKDPIVERKTCPYTGQMFPIHQSYIDMLEQLSPVIAGKKQSIPLPAYAHSVRERIRTMFRNEKKFYNSQSSLSKKNVVSLYYPDTITILTTEERRDDANDPLSFAQTWTNTKDYWSTMETINDAIPRLNIMTSANENCDYTSGTGYCKDCYLICASEYAEKCMYSKLLQTTDYILDSLNIFKSSRLYQCINCKDSNKSVYLKNSSWCHNCRFSDQLTSCSNCFLCSGLVNKQYYYKNKPLPKKEREEKIQQIQGSYIAFQTYFQAYQKILKNTMVKYADVINVEKVIGNNVFDSKNCFVCFQCNECEDCSYLTVGEQCKRLLDCNNMYVGPEKSYNVLGTINTFDVHMSLYNFDSKHMLYCQDCYDCSHCFWCFGLRNQEYCIYNKQYGKTERETKTTEIIEQMQRDGNWGEFFPTSFAQFPYNDTVAMEYYPIEKIIDTNGEETIIDPKWTGTVKLLETGTIVKAELDLWGIKTLHIKRRTIENEINIPNNANIISAQDLSDNITQENEDITNKVILCEKSNRPYRILKQEFSFYQKMWIPLPRRHQDIRYEERLNMLQPKELYHRRCNNCNKETISVYPNTTKQKVLCEQCYVHKIYG